MTDRQMHHMLSHAIAAAQPIAEKYYHVCWWNEAVRCHPVGYTTEPHEVFLIAPGSDFDKVKLSVLTHTGPSMLGCKVGDTLDGCLKIPAVPYQPEAAGDLHR
jgi:hypothetical protein